MLSYSKYFNNDTAKAILFNPLMWEQISLRIFDSVKKNAANSTQDLKKMSEDHPLEMQDLLDEGVAKIFGWENDTQVEKCNEAAGLLHFIGFKFLEEFNSQIKTSCGKMNLQIHSQVESLVSALILLSYDELFDDETIAEHAYYVIGFLGNQLENEAKRRNKRGEIRRCMEHFCRHFIKPNNNPAKVELLREELPTSLVDACLAFGGLRYTDV